jgi:thiol-disulfide isomerase/thioredoxin
MKKIKYIFLFILSFLFILPSINAEEKKQVNVYLFHSNTCSHCKAEIEFLNEIQKEYENLKINLYEINNVKENKELMINIKEKLNIDSPMVPFTVIGDYYYIGYNDGVKDGIKNLIEKYTSEEQYDVIKDIIDGKDVSNFKIKNGEINKISTVFGEIDPAKVSLPILSVIMGAIDGFNPCAMWVLIFLITMLFNMENKKRMWALGITFLVTSALIYLVFMFVWLGVATKLLTTISWLKLLIGLIALIGAFINLKGFIKSIVKKDAGCEVVDNSKRKKIISKIKKYTSEKSFILAMLGVMLLAISVNAIELACSAGLPVLFTNVLALNDVNFIEKCIYIFIYIFFFLIDDIIVFFVAMFTLNIKALSTKYTKYSHLIGGIIMLIIGILIIFKPEWLMFNF